MAPPLDGVPGPDPDGLFDESPSDLQWRAPAAGDRAAALACRRRRRTRPAPLHSPRSVPVRQSSRRSTAQFATPCSSGRPTARCSSPPLGVGHVCDLGRDQERATAPDRLPNDRTRRSKRRSVVSGGWLSSGSRNLDRWGRARAGPGHGRIPYQRRCDGSSPWPACLHPAGHSALVSYPGGGLRRAIAQLPTRSAAQLVAKSCHSTTVRSMPSSRARRVVRWTSSPRPHVEPRGPWPAPCCDTRASTVGKNCPRVTTC
jgi:hypothetical protein